MSLFEKLKSMIFESDTPSFDDDDSESCDSLSTGALIDDTLKSYFQESTTEISSSTQRSFFTSVDSGVSSLVEERLDNVIQEVLNNHKIKTSKRRKKIINKILSSNLSKSFLENSKSKPTASYQNMSGQISSSQVSEKPSTEIDDIDHQIAKLMKLREQMKKKDEKQPPCNSSKSSPTTDLTMKTPSSKNDGKLANMIDPKETVNPESTVRALVRSFGSEPLVQKTKSVVNKRTYSEVAANKAGTSQTNNEPDNSDDNDHHVAEKKAKNSSSSPKNMEELKKMLAFPQLQKEPVLNKSVDKSNKDIALKKVSSKNFIHSESERSEKALIIDEGQDHENDHDNEVDDNDHQFEHSTIQKSASKESRIQHDSGVHDVQVCKKVVIVSSDDGEKTTLPERKRRSCQKVVNKTIDYDPSSSSNDSDHEDDNNNDGMNLRIESSEFSQHPEDYDDDQIRKLIQFCRNEENDQRPLGHAAEFPQMSFSKLKEKNISMRNCLTNVTLLKDLLQMDKDEEMQILNSWPTISSTKRSEANHFILKLAKWIQFMSINIMNNTDYITEARRWQFTKFLDINEFLNTSTESEVLRSKFWDRQDERLPKYTFGPFTDDLEMLSNDIEPISEYNIDKLISKPNRNHLIYVGIIAKLRMRQEACESINDGSSKIKHTALFARSLYYWDSFLRANPQFKKLNNKNLSSATLQHYDCCMKFTHYMCSTMTEEAKSKILKTRSNDFFEHAPETIFLYFYYNARIRTVVVHDEGMVKALEAQAFKISESMIVNNKSSKSFIENRITKISQSLSEYLENFERRYIIEVETNRKIQEEQQKKQTPPLKTTGSPLRNKSLSRRSVDRFDDLIMINRSSSTDEKKKSDDSKKSSSSSTTRQKQINLNAGYKSDNDQDHDKQKSSYRRSPVRRRSVPRSDLPSNIEPLQNEISKNYKEKLRTKYSSRRKFTPTSRTGKQISKWSPDRSHHDRPSSSKGRALIKNHSTRKTDRNNTRDRSPKRDRSNYDEIPSSSTKFNDYHQSNESQSSSRITIQSSKADADRNPVSVSFESQQQCMNMMMNGMKMMNDIMKKLSENQVFQAKK